MKALSYWCVNVDRFCV